MNRLGSCFMHPLLLLITLVLLATSALSTKQSNPPKLRPERILDTFYCEDDHHCRQGSMFNGNKATYSVLVPSGSQFTLEVHLYPDDQKTDLILDFEADPSPTYFRLVASSAEQWNKYEQFFYFEQPKTTTTVTGPIISVYIKFENAVGNPEAHITVTITSPGHSTPAWVIPVSVSIGVLILATVAVLCYRQKRRNRQTTSDQPVHIRHQNMRQRNQNARPRNKVNPPKQLSTQAIIDMRFPEAKFERFKSDFQQKTCTICLDDMKKGQICRQLDCQHIFHTQCGKLWLENQFQKIKKAFCPNCNQQVDMLNPKKCPKAKERRV